MEHVLEEVFPLEKFLKTRLVHTMPHAAERNQLQVTAEFFTVTSTVQAQSCFCLHLCHGCKSKHLQKSENKFTSLGITAVPAGTGVAFLTEHMKRSWELSLMEVWEKAWWEQMASQA